MTSLNSKIFFIHSNFFCGLLFILFSVFSTTKALAANSIQTENLRTGTAEWTIPVANRAENHEIEGYASLTSVNRGGTINLFVSTIDPTYTVEIYRMGWYRGTGARKVMGPISRGGIHQVTPVPNVDGLVECNWTDPLVISTSNPSDPTDWMSGVYLAKLTAQPSGKQQYIVFNIRDDNRTPAATYLFVSGVNTWQAYNAWGGKSLYPHNSTDGVPAVKVSFNRPYDDSQGSGLFSGSGSGTWGGWELNMLRFLEREGYDVNYVTNVDLHEQKLALLSRHKGIIINGHDEYWSYDMRQSLQQARDSGKNIAFLGANAIYWQIRFAPSTLPNQIANRTIVAYKESAADFDPYSMDSDPSNDKFITDRWRDLPGQYGVDDPVAQPENAVIGVQYHGDPFDGSIIVTNPGSWVYAGTNVTAGTAFKHLLGYETDSRFSNGYTPSGIENFGKSPDTWGYSYMTNYHQANGGWVIAVGSVWWAFGLDDLNVPDRPNVVSPNIQQATRNILTKLATTK